MILILNKVNKMNKADVIRNIKQSRICFFHERMHFIDFYSEDLEFVRLKYICPNSESIDFNQGLNQICNEMTTEFWPVYDLINQHGLRFES